MSWWNDDAPAQNNSIDTKSTSGLNSFGAGTLGFGEGITAGLIKYPQAALKMGVNAVTGYGGPNNTFDQNLRQVRELNQQAATEHMPSYYGGQLAGGVTLGLATSGTGTIANTGRLTSLANRLRTAGQAVGPIGTGTAIGAVSGATQNEYTNVHDLVRDTGLGAMAGGASAGVSYGLGELTKKLGKPFVDQALARGYTIEEINAALKHAGPSMLGKFVGTDTLKAVGREVKSAIAPAIGGAAIGAGAAALTGNDPIAGAAFGAGSTVAASKQKLINDIASKAAATGITIAARHTKDIPNIVQTVTPTLALASAKTAAAVADTSKEEPKWWLDDSVKTTKTPQLSSPSKQSPLPAQQNNKWWLED